MIRSWGQSGRGAEFVAGQPTMFLYVVPTWHFARDTLDDELTDAQSCSRFSHNSNPNVT